MKKNIFIKSKADLNTKNNVDIPADVSKQVDDWISNVNPKEDISTKKETMSQKDIKSAKDVRLNVRISDDLSKKIKQHCFKNETTIQDFIIQIIEKNL